MGEKMSCFCISPNVFHSLCSVLVFFTHHLFSLESSCPSSLLSSAFPTFFCLINKRPDKMYFKCHILGLNNLLSHVLPPSSSLPLLSVIQFKVHYCHLLLLESCCSPTRCNFFFLFVSSS